MIIKLSGLNVYNPTDAQLLALVKADTVQWDCRGRGKYYDKRGVQGPDNEGNYHVLIGPETMSPCTPEEVVVIN